MPATSSLCLLRERSLWGNIDPVKLTAHRTSTEFHPTLNVFRPAMTNRLDTRLPAASALALGGLLLAVVRVVVGVTSPARV